MKKILATMLLSAASAASAQSFDPYPELPRDGSLLRTESFYDVWIRDRLSIGLSFSYNRLTDGDRPPERTFLGFINDLEADNELDWAPTVSWIAGDFVRLGLTWHTIEAHTMNCNVNAEMGRSMSDGVGSMSGPLFMVEGRYPLQGGAWCPHAGVGIGFYDGSFDEDTWWDLGYSSPKAWARAGKPSSKTSAGKHRYIGIEDKIGFSILAGVAWRPIERFELDLSLRQTFLETDCEFGYISASNGDRRATQTGEFSFDCFSVVLTASYVF